MDERRKIMPWQIKMIHMLKSLLRRDDETYHGALRELYGVATSKALTYSQAAAFIGHLREAAERLGLWSPSEYGDKYENFRARVDMASPRQLRMVEGIWAELYPDSDEKRREAALNTYLTRFFRVSHPRFLDSGTVSKVLHALKEMLARKEKTAKKPAGAISGPEADNNARMAGNVKFKRV